MDKANYFFTNAVLGLFNAVVNVFYGKTAAGIGILENLERNIDPYIIAFGYKRDT